jgi:hypothetical protein
MPRSDMAIRASDKPCHCCRPHPKRAVGFARVRRSRGGGWMLGKLRVPPLHHGIHVGFLNELRQSLVSALDPDGGGLVGVCSDGKSPVRNCGLRDRGPEKLNCRRTRAANPIMTCGHVFCRKLGEVFWRPDDAISCNLRDVARSHGLLRPPAWSVDK